MCTKCYTKWYKNNKETIQEHETYDRDEAYHEFTEVMKDYEVTGETINPDSKGTDQIRKAMKQYGYDVPHSTITGWKVFGRY